MAAVLQNRAPLPKLRSPPKLLKSRDFLKLPVVHIASPLKAEYFPRTLSRAASTTPVPWKLDTKPPVSSLTVAGKTFTNIKPVYGESVFRRKLPQDEEKVGVQYSWDHLPAERPSLTGTTPVQPKPIRLAPFDPFSRETTPTKSPFQYLPTASPTKHVVAGSSPDRGWNSPASSYPPRDLGLSYWPRPSEAPTVSMVGPMTSLGDRRNVRPSPELAPSPPVRRLGPIELSVIDKQTIKPDSQPVESYHRRRQYGQALERNWFRQLRDFQRQQRQKRKLDGHVKKHMSFFLQDFDRAFFLPDSEDEATTGDDGTVDVARESRSSSKARAGVMLRNGDKLSYSNETHQIAEQDDDLPDEPEFPYMHFASMDANVSECESEHSGIDIELKDGALHDNHVRHKSRRLLHQRQQRFRFLHEKPEDASDSDSDAEEELVKLTDAELRAMRLQLRRNDQDNGAFQITQTPEEILAEINKLIAQSNKMIKVKRKKRRRKRRPTSADEREERAERARMMKSRFMSEFGFLLSAGQRNLANRDQTNAGTVGPTQSSEMAKFLREMDEAKKLRQARYQQELLGRGSPDSGIGEGKKGAEDGSDEAEDEISGLPNIRSSKSAEHLSRRHSHAGFFYSPRRPRKADKNPMLPSEVDDQAGKDMTKSTKQQADGEDDHSQGRVPPKHGFAPEPADVAAEFWAIKRPSSARHARHKDTEISLRELVAGIDFPAKEIKLQIAERRIKRQRQKRLLAEKQAKDAAPVASDTQGSESDEAEDKTIEDEGTNPINVFPKYLSRPSMADIFKPLLWEPRYARPLSSRTKDMLDTKVIPYLSDMFLEMRHCRYIRWNLRDQAIISRLVELELFHLGSSQDDLF